MKGSLLNDEFFARLESLAFNLKSNLAGYFGGKHLVKTYGQTVEFSDYREYQLGDDIRRIDWNLYSRFEKYFLKLFTDERQMKVQIFLDCSASMGKENPIKADYAVAVSAALGYLAIHNMDKVSFNLMKGNRSINPFGTIIGKNAFFRAIGELENIKFEGDGDISACIASCPEEGVKNGLSVIVSDFFTECDWKKAVDYLLFKGRQVLLVQTLSADEADPLYDGRINLIDSEAPDILDSRNLRLKINRSMQKAYLEALNDFKNDIKTFCIKRGVDFISVNSNMSIEKELFGQLFKAGIMS